jgi:ribonuclease BN (tRNA processing enzyme)
MSTVRVAFLGSGDAFCSAGRHQAGYLVQTEKAGILLDCGTTTLASLKRDRISSGRIDAILISHLHGDHFAGLPFLFLEFVHVEPRTRPLLIGGPPGTEERVRSLFRAMYRDAASEPLPFPLEFAELQPQCPAALDGFRVDPFRVPHQQQDISLGFTLEIAGRRILYSGDTGWTEDLIEQARATDLFICECTFFHTRIDTHLDYPRIAENRHRIQTKRLILTHLGSEVISRHKEVAIELAHDGLEVEV